MAESTSILRRTSHLHTYDEDAEGSAVVTYFVALADVAQLTFDELIAPDRRPAQMSGRAKQIMAIVYRSCEVVTECLPTSEARDSIYVHNSFSVAPTTGVEGSSLAVTRTVLGRSGRERAVRPPPDSGYLRTHDSRQIR